jgi:hypothetical protein
MSSDATLSRRGLLAGAPALAATVAPAVALPDPVRIRRDEILDRHLDTLARLDDRSPDDRRMILTAITDAIDCSMDEHDRDAGLLALQPRFNEVFDEWYGRFEADTEYQAALDAELVRRTGVRWAQFGTLEQDSAEAKAYVAARNALFDEGLIKRSYPPRTDEEIRRYADRLYGLVDEILSHVAFTREGLRLQCRAMIIVSIDDWNDNTRQFVASVARFLRMPVPDALEAHLYGWDDEDDREEDDESA